MRKHIAAALVVAGMLAAAWAPRAAAEDKGIIALQQMVSLLTNKLGDLQKEFELSTGMLEGLVKQNTDTVNKLSNALANIQSSLDGNKVVAAQQQSDVAKQFQQLADTIADLQAHLQKMDATLQQIHQMQQTIPSPAAAPATPSGPDPVGAFQKALQDFQAGSPAAQSELAAFIRTFPNDPQVPDATYYLGSLLMQKQQYNEAIDNFNQVIVQYSENPKAPLAELNKGISLSRLGNRSGALSELRAVAKNYPGTDAARQADIEINRLKKQ